MRKLLAGLLVFVAAVLVPVAVGAVWAKQTVTDQDRYLAVAATVSEVPQVRQEFRDRLVAAVVARINAEPMTADLLERAVTRAVDRVMESERFAELWLEMNRVVHAHVTGVLAGESDEFELTADGTLTMSLAPVVDALAAQLEQLGVSVPPGLVTDETVVLARSPELVRVQEGHGAILLAAAWLPVGCAVGLGLGLLLARRRAPALFLAGLLGAGASVALQLLLGKVPGALDDAVATAVAAALLASLEPWLWATAVAAAGVGLLAGIATIGLRGRRT